MFRGLGAGYGKDVDKELEADGTGKKWVEKNYREDQGS